MMEKINFDFKNKTAIITGGAQGFGLDIAKRFLNSGAKVIIWDIDPKMIEKSINQTLGDIGKLNKALKKGLKIRKDAAIQIGMAKKAAKSDGFFSLTNLVGIYDTVKDLPDLRENWKEISFDKFIDWLTSEE